MCTFNVGFTQASFDESTPAWETAKRIGTDHHLTARHFDGDELRERMLDVSTTNDELFADSSLLAVDILCEEARKHVTVALSGDGADELLAGYDTYLAGYLTRAWRTAPRPLRALVKRGVEALPPSTERYNKRDFALRFLRSAELGRGRDFASFRTYLDDEQRAQLVRAGRTKDSGAVDTYARAFDDADGTLLKKMLVADLEFYLPSDMLTKVDRASMRHGLEVRVPFLDVEFVDWALTLPSQLLLSPRGTKKRILRRHVARTLGPTVARRRKTGFNVPLGAGFKNGVLRELLLDAVRSRPFLDDGPLDVAAVERLADDHAAGRTDAAFGLYAVLVLALWWHTFLAAR